MWTLETLPGEWALPAAGAAGAAPARPPERRSACELEVDARVEHVLNRGEVRRQCILFVPVSLAMCVGSGTATSLLDGACNTTSCMEHAGPA